MYPVWMNYTAGGGEGELKFAYPLVGDINMNEQLIGNIEAKKQLTGELTISVLTGDIKTINIIGTIIDKNDLNGEIK